MLTAWFIRATLTASIDLLWAEHDCTGIGISAIDAAGQEILVGGRIIRRTSERWEPRLALRPWRRGRP
jgi:hypothetical protein